MLGKRLRWSYIVRWKAK